MKFFLREGAYYRFYGIDFLACDLCGCFAFTAPSAPLKFKIQGRKEFPDFRWKSPRTPNGRVRSYILEIYDSTDGQLVFNRTIISKGSFTLRSTLKYYHTYLAKLRAVTVKPGPAAEKTFRTAEGRELNFDFFSL